MADEGSGGAGSPPPKTYTQAEVDALKNGWSTREAELKKKADQWDEYESKGKSEISKLTEKLGTETTRANTAEKERDALKLEKVKSKIGKKYNIPPADCDRLQGTDEKSIEDDAKAWAKSRGLDKVGGPTPAGAAGDGKANPNAKVNSLIAQAAGFGGR